MEKKDISFEEAIQELEKLISEMETPGISLERSFALFQQGMDLTGFCTQTLQNVEKQVMMVSQLTGDPEELPFSPET